MQKENVKNVLFIPMLYNFIIIRREIG